MVEDINWEKRQLAEVMVVENHHQRLMEERWNPATVAVKDVDHAMLDEILREKEELDESHKLSDEDETIIDALLDELELENADQDGRERSEFLDVEEVPVPCTGVYKVSAECICDVTKATGRSETDIEAEGKCSFQSTKVDCSHERHYCQNPDEVTPPTPSSYLQEAILCIPQKAWQIETRQNGDAPTANATETGWDPTLEQPKEEINVEVCKPMQCPTRRYDAAMYVKPHPLNT